MIFFLSFEMVKMHLRHFVAQCIVLSGFSFPLSRPTVSNKTVSQLPSVIIKYSVKMCAFGFFFFFSVDIIKKRKCLQQATIYGRFVPINLLTSQDVIMQKSYDLCILYADILRYEISFFFCSLHTRMANVSIKVKKVI